METLETKEKVKKEEKEINPVEDLIILDTDKTTPIIVTAEESTVVKEIMANKDTQEKEEEIATT